MKKIFNSISVRLAFRFTLILSVAILLVSMSFVWIMRSFVRRGQDLELIHAADVIEHGITDRLSLDYANLPFYITYTVFKNDEQIFTNDPFLPPLPETFGKTKIYEAKNFFINDDLKILYFARKSKSGEYTIMTAMGIERDISSRLLLTLPKTILLAIFPILILSYMVLLFITKRTMRPVIKITESATKISSSNLGTLLPLSGNNDELDKLAETFNRLFERLKADFDLEKQFTSDVSHELKTPLAVILGQTNLLLRWGKDEPLQLEKSLKIIKNESKSMEAIITNLLQISRLENGKIKPQKENVNVLEMFLRLKSEFESVSPESQFKIECNKEICVLSDWELLHQVLTIIISNSIKFVKENCVVTMKAFFEEEKTVILVSDNGSGFAENVLPHVFERFYRGDEAHVRSAGGSGLGLSIAEAIITSFNGTIEAQNTAQHGALIRILLNTH